MPFINLTAKPELRECFLKCKLPHQGLRLEHVTIESSDGQALATWAVEVHGHARPRVSHSSPALSPGHTLLWRGVCGRSRAHECGVLKPWCRKSPACADPARLLQALRWPG